MSKRIVIMLSVLSVAAGVVLRAQAPGDGGGRRRGGAGRRSPGASNDLSQVAAAGVRSQLLVTRTQLQEQRLIHLDRQRAEGRRETRDAEKIRTRYLPRSSKRSRPRVTRCRRSNAATWRACSACLRGAVQATQAIEATLRAEQDALLNSLSAEQSR